MSMPSYSDTAPSLLLKPPRGGFLDIGLSLNWFAVFALMCGIASARMLNLVGEIYAGELLLIQCGFLLLLLGKTRPLTTFPVMGVFLQTAVLMLLGYMLSDIYRDTSPAQFLRGWARIILVTLDFVALVAIIAHDKRNLWWFVLGMGIGAIGQLLIRGVPMMSPAGWKFGWSTPLVTLLACMSCLLPVKFVAIGFIALGVANIFMDFRIQGAICVAVAAILWIRDGGMRRMSGPRLLQLFAVCMVAGGILAGAMMATSDEFAKRREQSNVGRAVGLSVATLAITESPLIGYGSWPMDPRLVNLYYDGMEESGQFSRSQPRGAIFAAHSQILQGWIEGGLLGVLFWGLYGYWLLRAGWYVVLRRPSDIYMPMFLFFLIYNLWALFMSGFSGVTRLPIAVGIAIICMCAAEMRSARELPCEPLAQR